MGDAFRQRRRIDPSAGDIDAFSGSVRQTANEAHTISHARTERSAASRCSQPECQSSCDPKAEPYSELSAGHATESDSDTVAHAGTHRITNAEPNGQSEVQSEVQAVANSQRSGSLALRAAVAHRAKRQCVAEPGRNQASRIGACAIG
jgi:hypothetical protein